MQQTNIRWITRTAILMAIALVIQMGGFPQFITGPLVNSVLYLAAIIVGWSGGVLIGICTPVIASMRGILPSPLTPMVPFIALGNSVLVILFYWLRSKNKIMGMIFASVGKFVFLFTAVHLLVEIPPPVAQMMGFPQLITALVGGFFALLVARAFQSSGSKIFDKNEV